MAEQATSPRIAVTRVRSISGSDQRIQRTVSALGLSKIGKRREFSANEALLGMLKKINHLVRVEKI